MDAVVPDGPADHAVPRMEKGDIVKEIDGVSVASLAHAKELILGTPGSQVLGKAVWGGVGGQGRRVRVRSEREIVRAHETCGIQEHAKKKKGSMRLAKACGILLYAPFFPSSSSMQHALACLRLLMWFKRVSNVFLTCLQLSSSMQHALACLRLLSSSSSCFALVFAAAGMCVCGACCNSASMLQHGARPGLLGRAARRNLRTADLTRRSQ